MIYSHRAHKEARRREREAFDRRGKRMFWIGLTVPVIACAISVLLIRPESWLDWAAVIASVPAAATGAAIVFIMQDRRKGSDT